MESEASTISAPSLAAVKRDRIDIDRLAADARVDEADVEDALAREIEKFEWSEEDIENRREALIAEMLTVDRWQQVERRTGIDYRSALLNRYGDAQ